MNVGYLPLPDQNFIDINLVKYLQDARKLCNFLIVGVSNEGAQKQLLESLTCVDLCVQHRPGADERLKYDVLIGEGGVCLDREYDTNTVLDCITMITPDIFRCGNHIFKPVKLGKRERTAYKGSDVYNVAYPNSTMHTYPSDIEGVNRWRELLVPKHKSNPYLSHKLVYDDGNEDEFHGDNVHVMQQERRSSNAGVVMLQMKDYGIPLKDYVMQSVDKEATLTQICEQVETYVRELLELGIIHGDLHPGNVYIKEAVYVSSSTASFIYTEICILATCT